MILALECHEPRVGNPSCQHQAMLERHSSVPTTVQHESWNGDSRQQLRDVDERASDPGSPDCDKSSNVARSPTGISSIAANAR